MSEKPRSVEAGQLWSIGDTGLIGRILTPGTPALVEWHAKDDPGHKWRTQGWSDEHFLKQATYLGSDTPSPRPDEVRVGQRRKWSPPGRTDPFTVVDSGDPKQPFCAQWHDHTALKNTREFFASQSTLVLDATPVTPPKPQVRAPKCVPGCVRPEGHGGVCVPAGPMMGAPVAPAAPVYGRIVGEMRDGNGAPLTALQAIQAKPKPTPWVPSCDELFWIKDA